MAELVEGVYDFGRSRGETYPLSDWFDGQKWRLVNGEDFRIKPQSLVLKLRNLAKAEGLHLDSKVEDEHTVVIRARRLGE